MSRLIIVPQYPSKLRYQEWWWDVFPEQFAQYFSEILVLDGNINIGEQALSSDFAPVQQALLFETEQIKQYLHLKLKKDDVLLLNDLSFPGLFSSVLFHKRPEKCFAICHATSKNRYDYFLKVREAKYPVEKATAKLFDAIFVATEYHAKKLGWVNIVVTGLPFPPFTGASNIKRHNIVSVARSGKQKHNADFEKNIEHAFGKIETPVCQTWEEYYEFLGHSKILLITSNEETFGYQVLDAINNGCIPIAPNKYSYPELISKDYLYNNYIELFNLIDSILYSGMDLPILKIRDNFYEKTSNIMQNE